MSELWTRFGLALLGENKIDNSFYKVIIKKKCGLDKREHILYQRFGTKAHFNAEQYGVYYNGTQGTIILRGCFAYLSI